MGAALPRGCGSEDVHQVSFALGGRRGSLLGGVLTVGMETGVMGDGADEVSVVEKVSLR